MSSERSSVYGGVPASNPVEVHALDVESAAAALGSTAETIRSDRIVASPRAKALITQARAPRCFIVDGLPHSWAAIDLGGGRTLVLEGGLYRLVP